MSYTDSPNAPYLPDHGFNGHQGFIGQNPMKSRPSPQRNSSIPNIMNPASGFPPSPQRQTPPQFQRPPGYRRPSTERRQDSPLGTPPSPQDVLRGEVWICKCRVARPLNQGFCPTCLSQRMGTPVMRRGDIRNDEQKRGADDWVCSKCRMPKPGHHQYCKTCNLAKPQTPKLVTTPSDEAKRQEQAEMAERKKNLDEVLKKLIDTHIREGPPETQKDIIPAMLGIEDAYWEYLDSYVVDEKWKGKLPLFEKGLLKEFTYEVLIRIPSLCNLLDDPPTGGLDCERDEINKKKVADIFHRKIIEYKMTEPVAGVILLDSACEKVLMVRYRCSPSALYFLKDKRRLKREAGNFMAREASADCALRVAREVAGFDLSGGLKETDTVTVAVQRGDVQQENTFYIVCVNPDFRGEPTKQEVQELVWQPLASVPVLCDIVGQPPRPVDGFQTVSMFLEPLKKAIAARRQRQLTHGTRSERFRELAPSKGDLAPMKTYDTYREPICQKFGNRYPSLSRPISALMEAKDYPNQRANIYNRLFNRIEAAFCD